MPIYTLRDGSHAQDQRLDRLVQFDEASRNFRAVERLETEQYPRPKTWWVGWWLDQGPDGACVGFAYTHELLASPFRLIQRSGPERIGLGIAALERFAHEEVYWEAQKIDPWPGGSYPGADPFYEGTSILAGAKVLHRAGYIDGYDWAFGEEELWQALPWRGPAVVGTEWREGMFEPNAHGYIEPTGPNYGGHAYVVFRSRFNPEHYEIWNSWGKFWAKQGTVKISRAHMAWLLERNGEVMFPVVKR